LFTSRILTMDANHSTDMWIRGITPCYL
jgi:hypothetical protein